MVNKQKAISILSAAGVPDPAFEWRQMQQAAKSEEQLIQMLHRRTQREPLQYILGEWDFFDMTLSLGPGVLCPRPETEFVVEQALALIPAKKALDLCAGTGCMGLAVARFTPDCQVDAIELSKEAMPYLLKNIAKYGDGRVRPHQGDVLSWADRLPGASVDLIVCNPPYIDPSLQGKLMPEVQQEPDMALFAPNKGLYFYQQIIPLYKRVLRPGGIRVFEIGFDQRQAVQKLFFQNGYVNVGAAEDYSGNDRVVWGYAP